MILPYLAIVLLTLVTIYSAIVSFRPKVEGAAPTWLFPDSTTRLFRIIVGVSTVALMIGLFAWVSVSARKSAEHSLRFLIPENYTGWVRIEFEIPGAPPLPVENGQTVIRIPPSGVLRTSSPELGLAKDYYFLVSSTGVRPIPKSGSGRMIWGKIRGEESGPSAKRKYEDFFVGTEQQYKDQLK
jgi:hypothetical protein